MSVRGIARHAGIEGLAVCSNGALLLDLQTGAISREHFLDAAAATDLVRALRERLPGILFAVEHEGFAHEPGFRAWDWDPPPGTRVADATELLEQPATKLILRHGAHDVHDIAALAAELAGEAATVVASGDQAVEVTAAGISKATAVAELCAERGIAQEEVVAFGDYPNDLPLLTWAGLGVAVANAHPSVLDAADEVTLSNHDDGVAVVLERLLA